MKTVQEVLKSPWRNSEKTEKVVREQLRARYGDDVADEFDASKDAMPYASWLFFGYKVRPKERSLKSITYVDVKNEKGEVEKKIRRTCNLFHRLQVEKIA